MRDYSKYKSEMRGLKKQQVALASDRAKRKLTQERESWANWLRNYGAEKFFDHFVRNAQGALSRCVYCGQEIYLDIVEGGGVADWSTADELGGDYGCPRSPETTSEGTGGHMPERREL